MNKFAGIIALILAVFTLALSQNASPSPTPARSRPRVTAAVPTPSQTPKPVTPVTPVTKEKPAGGVSEKPKPAAVPGDSVLAAFNKIIEGIRRANVNLVTSGYLNSPALVLFNYNGSVTKGWDQMRKNRESSYPDIKDVKLELRDVHVQMLGRDGAVVTCLWTQTQTYKGEPDAASGRMTLAFKRVGNEWRAVHLHTSPDRPDPARVPSSEQGPAPIAMPTR